MVAPTQFPAEIVRRVCELVYLGCVPLCSLRTLDPEGLPSAAYDGQLSSQSVEETRRLLYALCLVNRTFYRYAQPLLFRRVQVTLPYRFMLLLQEAERDALSAALGKIRLLDFATFRALGLRRTVGESSERRFVTDVRLQTLIRACHGLVAFGASETMDSALSLSVLEELILHGGARSCPGRMRGVSTDRGRATDEHNALQSLDLCGCVSPRFVQAITEFVRKHLTYPTHRARSSMYDHPENDIAEGSDEERVTADGEPSPLSHVRIGRRHGLLTFPCLQRLGMAGVSLHHDILTAFVLAFPNLTHLDLSRTKANASLLQALGNSNVCLESLSLSRCSALTSESIVNLLTNSPTTVNLVELTLQGTLLFPSPLSPDDLRQILLRAPCIQGGALRYLDLGGCPLSDEELETIPPQPALLDLGLGSIPGISLVGVSNLLQMRAPNVQILDLAHSAGATLSAGYIHAVNLYHDLLRPCTQPPQTVIISQQLRTLGLKKDSPYHEEEETWQAPTNLRVVELASASLRTVRGGVSTWKVILGAGRRGWVVDVAAGPNPNAVNILVEPPEVEERGRGRSSQRELPEKQNTLMSGSPAPTFNHDSNQGRDTHPPASLHAKLHHGLARHATQRGMERHRLAIHADRLSRSRSLTMSAPLFDEAEEPLTGKGEQTPQLDHVQVLSQVLRDLPLDHPRRTALEHLSRLNGSVGGSIGWHSHKMEVLMGYGLLGHEIGNYAWLAYQGG
ncbi:hypothetical protein MVES1_000573 [Malassezia vespertilionis]|nr:uncharacterized protein MVES1_000573 [Malassezia vespertilionis]WFD05245.1 hypothetical protein MVES1_000573 [Malassezia vespertilionis]